MGALLVYGVLPRVLLAAVCAGLWLSTLRALRLDLSRAGYARLRPLLLPDSERIGVRDPEHKRSARLPRPALRAEGAGAAALVALELGADLSWPPSVPEHIGAHAAELNEDFARCDAGRLDSGEQRRAALQRFSTHPPRRLLIAVDPRRTPDRGNLGLIAELVEQALDTRVWALAVDSGPEVPLAASRLPQWREGLARLGFAPEALMLDAVAARDWLLDQEAEHRP